MPFKKFAPLLYIILFALAAFALHKLAFHFGYPALEESFYHSLQGVYGFFTICSMIILLILIIVRGKSVDNVGYTFLLLTCIKMAAAYAFLHPVITAGGPNMATEKLNFFIVFAGFLALETVLTIKILNKP